MPETDDKAPNRSSGNFLTNSTAGLPNWAWIVVVGVGIAAAYFLPKFFSGRGDSGIEDANGLGLALDPTTGYPYAVSGLVPSAGAFAGGGTTSTNLPPGTQVEQNVVKLPTMTRETILRGYGSGAQNIPLRDTPMGNVVGGVGFNERLELAGPPVIGPSNFGENVPVGSTSWYPVKGGGFISAFDVVNAGSIGPDVHGINRTMLWPYSTNTLNGLNGPSHIFDAMGLK